MFENCSYHLLDSLVPPSADEDLSIHNSLLRLENICACAIVKNGRNCQILSKTPTHLHKVLWKAYLRNEYYTRGYKLDKIPELLYHWPYEEFNLKEIMPKFPARLNSFSSFWDPNKLGPSYQNTTNLLKFYEKVAKTIVAPTSIISHETIALHHNCDFDLEQHENNCKVRKIDISGFSIFLLEDIIMVDINEPFFKNSEGKLEVILDVYLNRQEPYHNDIENALNRLAYGYSDSSNFVVVKFGHISLVTAEYLHGPFPRQDVMRLIERLVNNGVVSICLEGDIEVSNMIEKVFENNTSQGNILSVQLDTTHASSLNFVQYLKNLVHLDLSDNNLHGSLDSLMLMHRGLLFLNLHDCNLKNADLAQLNGSCHQSTLRELNLSNNSLSYDDNCKNLISLCQNLTNVLHLDLGACDLESWHNNEIELLFFSFKLIPNIVNLNLYGNRLSRNTVTFHIMVLHENTSLRYVELSLPTEFTESLVNNQNDLIKSFCFDINAKMNTRRLQLLYIDFAI